MRKWIPLLLSLSLMLSTVATPAYALEYTIDGPESGDFGDPTSDDTIYATVDENVDRSKNSALIPPGFGTPTSYLPGSGEYLTPNLAAGGPLNSGALIPGAGTVGGGTVTYPGAVDAQAANDPTTSTPATAYTDVTPDLYYKNGSLGTLKIPAVDLTVKVVQGTDSAALAKGAGHFPNTSIWDGNVCIAGHNRGTNCYFGNIHTLELGDNITLTTKFGTRTYAVTSVSKISETDNSMLAATSDNCITLFTCVRNEREYRWCVRAMEV